MSRRPWSQEDLYNPARLLARLEAKRRVSPTGCWEWTGYTVQGYGVIYIGNSGRSMTHRLAYEILVGPIPDGLQIDHLCRNRSCHNPDHLEPVTQRENVRRGDLPSAIVARTGICRRGHSMADAYVNTRGQRQCRTCILAGQRASYHAKKAATGDPRVAHARTTERPT